MLACGKNTININCWDIANPKKEISKHYEWDDYRHIGVPQIGNTSVPEVNFYKPN